LDAKIEQHIIVANTKEELGPELNEINEKISHIHKTKPDKK